MEGTKEVRPCKDRWQPATWNLGAPCPSHSWGPKTQSPGLESGWGGGLGKAAGCAWSRDPSCGERWQRPLA